MIVGTGVDLIAVKRIQEAVERHGMRFLSKIFTQNELEYSRGKAREFEHLAARFAAKEAVLKAFGTGAAAGVSLRDVEVVNSPNGKPDVVLHGKAYGFAQVRGVTRIHLSLSHADEYAVAQVVMEGG